MTDKQQILDRKAKWERIERAADEYGRVIGVKRLTPSQQIMVQEMAPTLEGSTAVVDDDPSSETYGKTINVPKTYPLIIAASVREIDGRLYTFPKSRAELNAVLDVLEDEGLKAAASALSKFSDGQTDEEIRDAAKN